MNEIVEKMGEALGQLKENLLGWVETLVLYLPNLILAGIIIASAFFFAKYVRRGSKAAMRRISAGPNIVNLVGKLSVFLFGVVVLLVVLSVFNLSSTINRLLAAAGVAGLAVGMALQDPLSNMFSGVFMSVKGLYKIGDLVETNGFFGTIDEINLRVTRIKLVTGEDVVIPNKMVIQNPLTNYSYSAARRIDLDCGVSYGDDLTEVENIVKEAIGKLPNLQQSKPVQIIFTAFGDSSINFTTRYWIENTSNFDVLREKSRGIKAIKEAFDRHDIAIPFPIRTLDFGVKGGVNLEEVWPDAALQAEMKDMMST